MEKKKLYFCASIRGGRQDLKIYKELISLFKKKYIVLTEHIAFDNVFQNEAPLTEIDIYKRDCAWLNECDMVIAEVTTPSLGVGVEIALAEQLNKPIVCIYRKLEGKRISAMILGNPNLKIFEYKTIQDIEKLSL